MSAEPIKEQYELGAEVSHTSPTGVKVVLLKYGADEAWAIKTPKVLTEPELTEALRFADQLGAKFLVAFQVGLEPSQKPSKPQRINVAEALEQPIIIARIVDKFANGEKIKAEEREADKAAEQSEVRVKSAASIKEQYAAGAEVNHTSPEGVHVVLIKYDEDTWAIKTAAVPNHFNLKHTEPALTEALRLADQLDAKFLVAYQTKGSHSHARIHRIDVAKTLDQPDVIERIADKLAIGQKITDGDVTIERTHNKIYALTTTEPLTDNLKLHAVYLAQSVGATELMYVENANARCINVQEGMTARTALMTACKNNDPAAAGKALANYVSTMQLRSFENDALWEFPNEFYTPDATAIIKREFALHTTNPALIDTLGAALYPDNSPAASVWQKKKGWMRALPSHLTAFLAIACIENAIAQSVDVTYLAPPPAQPTVVTSLLPHSYEAANCSFQVRPVSGVPATIVTQLAATPCRTLLKLDGLYYPIANSVNAYAGIFTVDFPATPARTCSAGINEPAIRLLNENRQTTDAPLLSLSQYIINIRTDLITFDVFQTSPQPTVVININTQTGNVRCTNPVNNPTDSIFKNGFENPSPSPSTTSTSTSTSKLLDNDKPDQPLFEIVSSNRMSKINPIGTLDHKEFTIAKQNSVIGAVYLSNETGKPSFREDKRGFGYLSSAKEPDLAAIGAMLELANKRFEGEPLRISGNQVFQKQVKELALQMGTEVQSNSFFDRAKDFLAIAPAVMTRPAPIKNFEPTQLETASQLQPTKHTQAHSDSPMSP